jgi:hypothetical protein
MRPFVIKRSSRLLVAVFVVLGVHTTTALPTASADDGATALACSVPSGMFTEWARKLANVRGGAFTTIVGGAALTYGCTKALKSLDSGQSGLFDLQAPDGTVISQRLSPGDFTTQIPTYTYTQADPRSLQCSGWTIPRFYEACLNYQLDPM